MRRVIRNGEFYARHNTAWENDIVISRGTYAPSNPKTLYNVNNIANIQAGSPVEGNGVGREIYATSVDINSGEATLTEALYDAEGTQDFTFTRFKYMLDFSSFDQLVNGNTFRAINGAIDRIEAVDTSLSDLDRERFFQIQFQGNNSNNITTQSANHLRLTHHQNSAATLWTIDTAQRLPF